MCKSQQHRTTFYVHHTQICHSRYAHSDIYSNPVVLYSYVLSSLVIAVRIASGLEKSETNKKNGELNIIYSLFT